MAAPTRALKVGLIRGTVLGGLLGLVAGPFGVAVGAVAGPLALLEARAANAARSTRTWLAWATILWAVALVGCFLAYGQGVYASAAWHNGPQGGVQALLAELERLRGSEAQTLRLYLLCGGLGYGGASLTRLRADPRTFLWLGLLTGVGGTLLSPLAQHGTWLDQLGASVMLVPCLAAGAFPFWIGLAVFYAAVDAAFERWSSRPSEDPGRVSLT
jgi:hypothetical protein